MVILSVAVMAHPARRAQAQALAGAVGAVVVWDQATDGRPTAREWVTGAAAWRAHTPGATHHLVLQDDAVVPPGVDLVAAVTAGLARLPAGDWLSGYYGRTDAVAGRTSSHGLVARGAAIAAQRGAAWIVIPSAWWGVALAGPVAAVEPMLAWCERRVEPYDMRIGRWCRHDRRDIWHTWPSLVDHADGPSLVLPARRPGRRAWRAGGPWDPAGPRITLGTNKRPQSMTAGVGVRSGLGATKGAMVTRPVMHDPHRERTGRAGRLADYLTRRQEGRPGATTTTGPDRGGVQQDVNPGILPRPVPAPLPVPQPPDPGPLGSPDGQPVPPEPVPGDQDGPGEPVPGPDAGRDPVPVLAATQEAPPARGAGSGAPEWRRFLTGVGYDPAALEGLGRDELVDLYTGAT